jgi:uncharacterized damage-inducible protein DinB
VVDLSAFYSDLRADERTTLEQVLEYQRQCVNAQVADLDDDEARARVLGATDMTAGGILKHLAWAEDRWFHGKLLGLPLPEPWASMPDPADPDGPFRTSDADSVEDLVALYATSCARSRATLSGFDSLDATAAVESFGAGPASLRWILVHMIEEVARHAGHLDVIRDALGKPTVG